MRQEMHIAQIIRELEGEDLLPAILFRSSRLQCDNDVERASGQRALALPLERRQVISTAVREICRKYEMEEELVITHPHYQALLSTGVGAHHAGQLLLWRLLLEELMSRGHLRVLVATGTVAAGVDFPARTVVITAHSRRGAEGFQVLSSTEFQQMSGRAGRRGKDTVGFCLAAPAPFLDARALLKIAQRPPEPLVSAYFPSPSTVLNLLRYRNVDDLEFTVDRSLAAFVDRKRAAVILEEAKETLEELRSGGVDISTEDFEKENFDVTNGGKKPVTKEQKRLIKKVRRLRRQAEEMEGNQAHMLRASLRGLRQLGYVDGSGLSEKGYWSAQLCTSLVLELAEMIESKLFENASAEKLVALVAPLCADPHRTYLTTKDRFLSDEEKEALEGILKRVSDLEMPGITDERAVVDAGATTALTWMHAESWQAFRSILLLKGVAEGDAARLITQTAEQLNQLARLSESHSQLAFRAEEAKRRLLRPPLSEGFALGTD